MWQYSYQQLGCSKRAVAKMLHYARTQCVGKPFSNYGMARSILWPRQTDNSSFFCAGMDAPRRGAHGPLREPTPARSAELVAAILREGGLMDRDSNPGSATPETLWRIYKNRAAVAANPFVLRDVQATSGLCFGNTVGAHAMALSQQHLAHAHAQHLPRHVQAVPQQHPCAAATAAALEREALLQHRAVMAPVPPPVRGLQGAAAAAERRRAASPPRGHFRVVSSTGSVGDVRSTHQRTAACGATGYQRLPPQAAGARTGLSITLHSLDMSRR